MSELYDFLYLDTSKLHSFVSQIHGGLINEINEKTKQAGGLSAGLNIGVPPFSGKVDASKGKESEQQQIRQLTDPAYFHALYQFLKEEKKIQDITGLNLQKRNELEVGQFIEMQGLAEPPVLDHWIEQFRAIFNFMDKNLKLFTKVQSQGKRRPAAVITNNQMQEFKGILDFLADYIALSRKDPGRQYIRVRATEGGCNIWCGLLMEFIIAPLQSALPAQVQVFGRVERILKAGEIWKIVDLSHFNQATQANQLIDVLNGASTLLGQKQISETDFQAEFPEIFIIPIAIYR